MPPPGAHGGRRRKKHHGGGHEEGGHERWLVTYADMLTLLLVLFIVLFSISVVNTSKYIALKTSLAAVFGNGTNSVLSGGVGLLDNSASGTGEQLVAPGAPISMTQGQQATPTSVPSISVGSSASGYSQADVSAEVADYKRIKSAISTALASHGLKGAAQFAVTGRGLVVTVITNGLIFGGNSAALLPEGQSIVSAIAPALASDNRQIEVDGYTNQQKVSTYPYPSGWELSSARASAVVRALIAHGMPESRLRAVGYSDLNPLYPPSDPRSITRNRRVEIVALSKLPSTAAADLQAAAKTP